MKTVKVQLVNYKRKSSFKPDTKSSMCVAVKKKDTAEYVFRVDDDLYVVSPKNRYGNDIVIYNDNILKSFYDEFYMTIGDNESIIDCLNNLIINLVQKL